MGGESVYEDPWDQAEEIVNAIVAPVFPDRSVDVRSEGATGDGKTDDLPIIQSLINTLSTEGGGTLVFEKGVYYLRGPLELKSHIHLKVKEGAVLQFSAIPEDFLPVRFTRWEGTELFNYSPFIYAYQASNIAITGKGTIDGNAEESFGTWRPNQKPAQNRLRDLGNALAPLHERVFGKGHWLRPSFLQTIGCSNILIEGVKLIDSPFWMIHFVYSEHIIVRDILVDSFRLNNDGIDPDSSRYVLVENSRFRTGDDAVAIKSGRDAEGRSIGVPSENIVIRNNYFEEVHNGVAIGSEMSGGVRNVFIENCRVGNGRNLLYFKANLDRGGTIENVHVRNIEVDTASVALLRFQTNYHSYRGGEHPPTFKHFRIENVRCKQALEHGIWAEGHELSPLQDIVVRNLSIEDAKIPLKIGALDDVTLESVTINGETMDRTGPSID